MSTVYGTPSASTSFNVTATGLNAGIQMAAPVGFEMSLNNVNFDRNVLISANAGTVNSTIYLRLAANATAGDHSGNIALTTTNANPVAIPIPNSTVAKAPLKITLSNVQKTYGTRLTNGDMTNGFTPAGLVNSEVISSVNMMYGTGAAAADVVGSYPGMADGNTPKGTGFDVNNYTLTITKANIIVNKAILTITADDKTRGFGATNPTLTYSYSGFVNNETQNVLSQLPVATTIADDASPAGQYPITVANAVADNYSFNYVAGKLVVTPFIPPGLVVPNMFTPNGDGINDVWLISNIESIPNCIVNIFNRSGQKVFSSVGYGTPWNGSYKNINAPIGAYYYIIDTRKGDKLSGSVTIIR
jgi:gliding motility-associated-like protein